MGCPYVVSSWWSPAVESAAPVAGSARTPCVSIVGGILRTLERRAKRTQPGSQAVAPQVIGPRNPPNPVGRERIRRRARAGWRDETWCALQDVRVGGISGQFAWVPCPPRGSGSGVTRIPSQRGRRPRGKLLKGIQRLGDGRDLGERLHRRALLTQEGEVNAPAFSRTALVGLLVQGGGHRDRHGAVRRDGGTARISGSPCAPFAAVVGTKARALERGGRGTGEQGPARPVRNR